MDCPLEPMIRKILDEDKPGWIEETFACRLHWTEHRIVREPGQVTLLPQSLDGAERNPAKKQWPRGHLLEDRTMCFHLGDEARGRPLFGACAYCGTSLHVHAESLGAVKSGRRGTAYLEQRCPACHVANAVYPTASSGVRTAKLAGAPAMQMKLLR